MLLKAQPIAHRLVRATVRETGEVGTFASFAT